MAHALVMTRSNTPPQVKVEDDAKAKEETRQEKMERLKKEQDTKAKLEERKVVADARVVRAKADIKALDEKSGKTLERLEFAGTDRFRTWQEWEMREKYSTEYMEKYRVQGKIPRISDDDLAYYKKLQTLEPDRLATQLASDTLEYWENYETTIGAPMKRAYTELEAATDESASLGTQIETADAKIAATTNELRGWSTGSKIAAGLLLTGAVGVGIVCVGGCPGMGGESPSPSPSV